MRSARELVLVSRQFAREQRWRSWWCLWSTLILFIALLTLAAGDRIWPFRLACSGIAGLTLVRLFTIFHDHQHGTILRGSLLADLLMGVIGLICLSPPSVWK